MQPTVAQLIDLGFQKSKKNTATVADSLVVATEGVSLVNDVFMALYTIAARVNPYYFSASEDVDYDAPGWARPEAAQSIWYMEQGGAEVIVVPTWERKAADKTRLAVHRFGGVFQAAGAGADPALAALTFYYSRNPVAAEESSDAVDALWPVAYNELVAYEIAVYLAVKDGRSDELAGMVAQRDRWLRLFLAFLEHETTNEVRRTQYTPRQVTAPMVPLSTLLTGGTTVTLPGG